MKKTEIEMSLSIREHFYSRMESIEECMKDLLNNHSCVGQVNNNNLRSNAAKVKNKTSNRNNNNNNDNDINKNNYYNKSNNINKNNY